MIGEQFECARPECIEITVKVTHNMKFCSNECCRIETNRKIMRDYHEKKAIRGGKKRSCVSCSALLSRYNPSKRCSACEDASKKNSVTQVKTIAAGISWSHGII